MRAPHRMDAGDQLITMNSNTELHGFLRMNHNNVDSLTFPAVHHQVKAVLHDSDVEPHIMQHLEETYEPAPSE